MSHDTARISSLRIGVLVLIVGATAGVAAVALRWDSPTRAAIIAAVCIVLWIGELVPMWVPTVLLKVGTAQPRQPNSSPTGPPRMPISLNLRIAVGT